jgi:hypothetical protein
MVAILSALVPIFAFRFRGRASLEIELIALRHQVTVLRRQRPDATAMSVRGSAAANHRSNDRHPR